jgi:hypothetical protein
MGLISGLLTLPLAPVRGTVWLAEQLTDEAERQLYDEDRIMRELLELELREEAGDIDARTREEREDELLERLMVARERHRLSDGGGGEDGR